MGKGLFIGDLAKRTGMSTKTIRYYEGLGLLSEPQRTESGYRLYSEKDVEGLRFIHGAKALGLSLSEIKQIVGIWSSGSAPCGHVSQLLDEKLASLDRRIAELTTFRDELRAYKDEMDRIETPFHIPCKHIEGVASGQWLPTVPEPAEGLGPKNHHSARLGDRP
jgi:DNA-binding transcriptional MerR regulator